MSPVSRDKTKSFVNVMEMTSLSPKTMTENNLFNTQSLPKKTYYL